MTRPKLIRPLDGMSNVSDPEVIQRCRTVQTNLNGNSHYTALPLDLTTFNNEVEKFAALVTQSADGSKKVIAEKNKQREVVTKMMRLLGRYVEVTSNGDMAVFQTSGFQAASTTKTTSAPLSEKIRKIDRGPNSGQIVIWVRKIPRASSYEIRYAPANAAPETPWTSAGVPQVKTPATITGLTKGTTYDFQARALTKDGYTDWTDSISFVCA